MNFLANILRWLADMEMIARMGSTNVGKRPFYAVRPKPSGVKMAGNARYPMPFQGEREKARRQKQLERGTLKP